MRIAVQSAPFDPGHELAAFTATAKEAGAVVSFTGLVRDDGGKLSALEIEHYPGMTEKALTEITDAAVRRWSLIDALVIHRHGRLLPGERIVLVVVTGAHRGEAFAACEFVMDYLKTRAPFWKKETTAAGSRWVEAREADDEAAARWDAERPGG